MNILATVSFFVGTILIIYISRRSLLHPRSHGFFRFFAWEGILFLIILNAPYWIDNPRSASQIISWILLTVSIYPVAHGVFLLQVVGKPTDTADKGSDLAFEKTTNLITSGIYRYIRHPLYASLLYLTWGVYFKNSTWMTTVISLGISLFLLETAKAEEKENAIHFGKRYTEYAGRTKMFIPYIW